MESLYRWMMNYSRQKLHQVQVCDWLCPNCLRWVGEVGNVDIRRTKNPIIDHMLCHACGHISTWHVHGPIACWADGENVAYERLEKHGVKNLTMGGLDSSGIRKDKRKE